MTTRDPDPEIFRFLRTELTSELGVPIPPLRLRADTSLNPGGFAVRVNAVRTLPRIGLEAGTLVVNDTPEQLRLLGVDAEPTLIPAARRPAAIVPADAKEHLESEGWTTWGPLQYMVLCIADEIRRATAALVTRDVVEDLLARLDAWAPRAVAHAGRHAPADQLAPVLRELLRDGVPIRNLRRIIELLLRRATRDQLPFDTAEAVTYVRAGLADEITARLAPRDTRTISVYLLDPELEGALAHTTDDAAERLVDAVRAERAYLQTTVRTPAVLTQAELRKLVRAVLRPEFADQPVIAYSELPPDVNVQPVARLSAP